MFSERIYPAAHALSPLADIFSVTLSSKRPFLLLWLENKDLLYKGEFGVQAVYVCACVHVCVIYARASVSSCVRVHACGCQHRMLATA